MEVLTYILNFIASIAIPVGGAWVLFAGYRLWKANKDGNPDEQTKATEGLMYGGTLAVFVKGIVEIILNSLTGF